MKHLCLVKTNDYDSTPDLINKFLYCCQLCDQSYSNIPNATFISNQNTDAQCYILPILDTLYIVFRGTSSFKDMKTDLHIFLTKFREFMNIKVHAGFYNQYLSIFQQIINTVKANLKNYKRIIFTGHSLGGGLATIAALDSRFNEFASHNIECITFGAPRVGNKDFIINFELYIKKCYRIVNKYDPIQYFPMNSKYHHTHKAICMKKNKIVLKDKIPFKIRFINFLLNTDYDNIVHHHRTQTYLTNLSKLN